MSRDWAGDKSDRSEQVSSLAWCSLWLAEPEFIKEFEPRTRYLDTQKHAYW
jgi:hypothetical protein